MSCRDLRLRDDHPAHFIERPAEVLGQIVVADQSGRIVSDVDRIPPNGPPCLSHLSHSDDSIGPLTEETENAIEGALLDLDTQRHRSLCHGLLLWLRPD